MRLVVLSALLAVSAGARAEPFAARPLTLPGGTFEVHAAYVPVHGSAGDFSDTLHAFEGGVDAGLTDALQVGVAAIHTVSPNSQFDRVALRAKLGVLRDLAMRVDVGGFRFRPGSDYEWGLGAGAGVDLRVRLLDRLALFVGRSWSNPPIGRGDPFSAAADLVTLDLNGSNVTASVGLPAGLLVQVTDLVALAARADPRKAWGGGNYEDSWVSVGGDLLLNPFPDLDLIASVDYPGVVDKVRLVAFRVQAALRF